jgi:hypothetical protein
MVPPSTRCGQVDQFRQNAPMWKEGLCWSEIKNLVNSELRAFVDELIARQSLGMAIAVRTWEMQKCLMQIVCFFFA